MGSEGGDAVVLDLAACGFSFACAKLAFQFADELLAAFFRLCGILFEKCLLRAGIGISDDAQFEEVVRRALCQKQDFRAILLGELFQDSLGEDFPAGREADGDISRFLGNKIVGLSLDADTEGEGSRQEQRITESHVFSSIRRDWGRILFSRRIPAGGGLKMINSGMDRKYSGAYS